MKSCPTCNRTFDDNFTFCLADGSLLNPPFEPGATEQLPPESDADSTPTKILYLSAEQDKTTRQTSNDGRQTSPSQTIASPNLLSGQDTVALSFTEEKSPTREEIPPPLPTTPLQASAPEMMLGRNQSQQPAPFAIETASPARLTQARSAHGKRWAIIVAGVIIVIGVGAIIWFAKGTMTRTSSINDAQPQQEKQAASPEAPAQTAEHPAPTGQSFTESANGSRIEMVSVPAGSFLMGSPSTETGRDPDEGPQSEVSVQNFYLDKDEVTQAQYQAVMGTNPSNFKGDDLPVESVSWTDATEFCRKLSKLTGHAYRLPTESEWEYAARAGTSGHYAGDIDAMAWDAANSDKRTHPVGQKQPNGFGLYDMNGNVWEWCQSKYKPYPYNANDGREDVSANEVRVMRGGSWLSAPIYCRSAYRRRVIPDLRSVGFRVVLAAH